MSLKQQIQDFKSTLKVGTKIFGVFEILQDMQWHCRECEYRHLHITQIAGGSGIQGLQRGGSNRQGIRIESDNHLCIKCNRTTRHDQWTGDFIRSVNAQSMPKSFQKRVLKILRYRDIVENTSRTDSHLTIDHKLPMIRWNGETKIQQTDYSNMTDNDIITNFQLLKKSNGSVSHNLLKSRSCEKCFKSGERGTPFGIKFYYEGDSKWKPIDKFDSTGCIGCGWYDFDLWRNNLNQKLD